MFTYEIRQFYLKGILVNACKLLAMLQYLIHLPTQINIWLK